MPVLCMARWTELTKPYCKAEPGPPWSGAGGWRGSRRFLAVTPSLSVSYMAGSPCLAAQASLNVTSATRRVLRNTSPTRCAQAIPNDYS